MHYLLSAYSVKTYITFLYSVTLKWNLYIKNHETKTFKCDEVLYSIYKSTLNAINKSDVLLLSSFEHIQHIRGYLFRILTEEDFIDF